MTRRQRQTAVAVAGVVVATTAFWIHGRAAGRPAGQVREITVVGDQFAFAPAVVEVQKDDLVQIKFSSKDIAHSFTVDAPYRISKRAGAGQTVVFEFRADETGRFRFYCNLTQDERCRKMAGELVVR
jgi:heme/copper-type cytochrome/quinol oxidase subunit 2